MSEEKELMENEIQEEEQQEVISEEVKEEETPQALEPQKEEVEEPKKKKDEDDDDERRKKGIILLFILVVVIILIVVALLCLKHCRKPQNSNTTQPQTFIHGGGEGGGQHHSATNTTQVNVTQTPTTQTPTVQPTQVQKFTIEFVDYDDTVLLAGKEYAKGTAVADIELPEEPHRAADSEYAYQFSGWTPALEVVNSNKTYKAVYTETAREEGIADKITAALALLQTRYNGRNKSLVYDESKEELALLKAEYENKIQNVATEAELNLLVPEFNDKAQLIYDKDLENDPLFTIYEKNMSFNLNPSDLAKNYTENTNVSEITNFGSSMFDILNGMSGGVLDVENKVIKIPAGETFEFNLDTTHECQFVTFIFKALTPEEEAATTITCKYYKNDGSGNYVEQTRTVNTIVSYTGERETRIQVDDPYNADGNHPITFTATNGFVLQLSSLYGRELWPSTEVQGRCVGLSVSLGGSYYGDYSDSEPGVLVSEVLTTVFDVSLRLKQPGTGFIYDATLDPAQYTLTLMKGERVYAADEYLTEEDSDSEGAYTIYVKLVDDRIPLIRSTMTVTLRNVVITISVGF